jgi:hypothetical protein
MAYPIDRLQEVRASAGPKGRMVPPVTVVADTLPPPTDVVELPPDDLGLRLLRLVIEHQQGHLLSHRQSLTRLTGKLK